MDVEVHDGDGNAYIILQLIEAQRVPYLSYSKSTSQLSQK
jgi:hypothetical protein